MLIDPTIAVLGNREVIQLAALGTEGATTPWDRIARVAHEVERLGFGERITTAEIARYLQGGVK